MSIFSRREFLERGSILSAVAAGGFGLHTAGARAADEEAKARRGGPNDRLRVAVVGVRSRGMSHVGGFAGKNNCDVTVICDCDEGVIGPAMAAVKKAQPNGPEPKFVQDIRKVVEDPNIDVVSIATPNHWHALAAVWAMRAGKHVYCEKPATHNVHEGRLMVEAARKHKRVCQVGTQSRSNPGMRAAVAYLHSGKLGTVKVAYGTCYKPRKSIGQVASPTTPPKTMDYSLWSGPAEILPVKRKGLHYDWHWIWAYGNGDFGNQGVHEADKARWGLNLPGLPTSVVSVGGRFGYVDDGETPNTQLCLYEYPGAHIMFEVRGLDTKDYRGAKVGNIWFCEKGYVVCPSYAGGAAFDRDGKKLEEFKGGGDQHHFDNFVKAVRAGKHTDLNCDVEEGHLSAALCHLGNISYRLGTPKVMADDIRAFEGLTEANEAFERMKTHLTDNKVDTATTKGLVGPKLTIDPKTEKFTAATGGADVKKANEMLFRAYRKGFDITEGA